MRKILVLFLLIFVSVAIQAGLVIAESASGTVDSKLPEITINNPSGGEEYLPEDVALISFEILEDLFAEEPIEPVNIQFYFDEQHNPAYDVSLPAADLLYEYDWSVPAELSDNVHVKVSATDYFGNAGEGNSQSFMIIEFAADFEADLTEGYAPLEVQFNDLSTGNIAIWAWDFQSDGIIDSDEQNPMWTYTEPGVYSVSLTISSAAQRVSDTELKNDYIVVNELPVNNVHNITQNTWFATIQGGIDESADFDTLIVNPGTYYENINFNGKAITLGSFFYTTQDQSYISQTVINGNQNGSVVVFNSGEDSTSVLCGFTITDGLADYGGGITCNNSSPTLTYMMITENSAEYNGGGTCFINSTSSLTNVSIRWNMAEYFGGGFYCSDSEPTLLDVTIFDNQANSKGGGMYYNESSPIFTNGAICFNSSGDSGGGVYCWNSEPILSEVTIYNNTTYNGGGGGFYCGYSTPTLSNMTIFGNSAEYGGGGIFISASNLIMSDVIIRNNTTDTDGGGIDCAWSTPILTNVTIKDNSASKGGGLCCFESEPTLTNVTIKNNSASKGGGLYCIASGPTLTNATIADNSASLEAGGVFCSQSSNPILVNSILWDNSPQEIYFNSEYISNSIIVSHSDIAGGLQAIATNNNGVIFWLEGNIDENPLFIDPEDGNYNLMEDSPCIDAGTAYFENDGEVIVNLTEDDYFGNAPDMGAYESGYYGLNADFAADVTEGNPPLEVHFNDLSTGNIIIWQWDFQGDGIIDSNEQNPLWTYTEPGVYSVSLTVSNETSRLSSTELKTDYITVFNNGVQPQGSGTESDPYQIENLDNLLWLSTNFEEWDKHYLQIADIDASATQNWNEGAGFDPIGYFNTWNDFFYFSGFYDGDGHTIEGLYVNRNHWGVGFFGMINNAEVKNLTLTEIDITGEAGAGGLIGSCALESEVTNCHVSGDIHCVSDWGGIGGLIGENDNSDITNCSSSVNITATGGNTGGLIGSNEYSNITNCSSDGNVIASGENTGGLIGSNNNESIITNCGSSCNVESDSDYVGGLIGYNHNMNTVTGCFSSGSVSGADYVGGLAGLNFWDSVISNCYSLGSVSGNNVAGGLVGWNLEGWNSQSSEINNSYSTGSVEATGNNAGGLVGLSEGSLENNSYWNMETSGQNEPGFGEGRTTEEMTYPYADNTYQDWDFTEIWAADIDNSVNNGYPYLAWQYDVLLAEFMAEPTEIAPGESVQFTDLSVGNPVSWQWDFQNDGIIDSDEQNPMWTYTEPGVYSVSLTISNDIVRDTATEIKEAYISVISENNLPQITNLSFSQRTDGSQLVDIYYDVFDADGDTLTVNMEVSDDGGVSWIVSCNLLSGDLGEGILSGSGKQIVWNFGSEHPGMFGELYRVRILVDDNYNEQGVDWCFVAAGEFSWGQYQETQIIDYDYEMMKYEVTNAQYIEYLEEALAAGEIWMQTGNVYGHYDGDEHFEEGEYVYYILGSPDWDYNLARIWYLDGYFQLSVSPGLDESDYYNHPVLYVTWFGANAFAEHYGWKLPTEQEWEKAARAMTFSQYPWGSNLSEDRANYLYSNDPFDNGTTPAGYYNGQLYGDFQTTDSPSPYGCYDMCGNAFEWTGSWYNLPNRGLRGGSWATSETSGAFLRSWYPHFFYPSYTDYYIGFRCARTLE